MTTLIALELYVNGERLTFLSGWQEAQAVEESSLPLLLPETADFKPTGQPDSPLANITNWVHFTDPQSGASWTQSI